MKCGLYPCAVNPEGCFSDVHEFLQVDYRYRVYRLDGMEERATVFLTTKQNKCGSFHHKKGRKFYPSMESGRHADRKVRRIDGHFVQLP